MSITETRTVGSIIGGAGLDGEHAVRASARNPEGRRIESRNPANLEDLVCEAVLADAGTFVEACRASRPSIC